MTARFAALLAAMALLLPAAAAANCPEEVLGDAAAKCAERGLSVPTRPFESDGCSLWPDGDWGDCCEGHDMDYWCGGSYVDRLRSDARLASCVARGRWYRWLLGGVMFLGVQAFGPSILPTPFRWGYGRDWPEAR